MKIRTRFALLTVTLVWGMVGAIALTIVRVERRLLQAEAARRREAVIEGVMRIAREARRGGDDLMLLSYLKLLRREHPELALAEVSLGGHVARLGEARPGLLALSRGLEDGELVSLGFDADAARRQIDAALAPLLWRAAAIAALFMLLGVVAVSRLSRMILGPLSQLADAVTALGLGRWDVSVPVGADDEVAALARRFNKMTASLGEVNAFREGLLHTLTHELNTPLGGIKAYLQLLRADQFPSGEKRRKTLDAMIDAIARMGESLETALSQFRAQGLGSRPAVAPTPLPYASAQPVAEIPAPAESAEPAPVQTPAAAEPVVPPAEAAAPLEPAAEVAAPAEPPPSVPPPRNEEDGSAVPTPVPYASATAAEPASAGPPAPAPRPALAPLCASCGIVRLREEIEEVLLLMLPLAQAKGINLIPPPSDWYGWAFIDKELLRRVLTNLVSNGIKYTPGGGMVEASFQVYGETVILWVADTGYGIPAKDVPRVFDKFSRAGAGSDESRAIPGTGLGLGIVKQSVEMMGGRIWLESGPGKGTIFYLELPQDRRKVRDHEQK